MTRNPSTPTAAGCPACGDKRAPKHSAFVPERLTDSARECRACGCVFTTEGRALYKGDSYAIVGATMTSCPEATARQVAYDLTVLGSDGVTRRHGFFDPRTKRITQVG